MSVFRQRKVKLKYQANNLSVPMSLLAMSVRQRLLFAGLLLLLLWSVVLWALGEQM